MLIKNRLLIIVGFLLTSCLVNAQIPQTDLFLFDLNETENGLELKNPQFLNHFNKGQYNNQPSFFNVNNIYFSAIPEGKDQTDIYAIDLFRKQYWQVTNTPHGEYSPPLMPSKKSFSVISQEAETNIQRLWSFPVDQTDSGRNLKMS